MRGVVAKSEGRDLGGFGYDDWVSGEFWVQRAGGAGEIWHVWLEEDVHEGGVCGAWYVWDLLEEDWKDYVRGVVAKSEGRDPGEEWLRLSVALRGELDDHARRLAVDDVRAGYDEKMVVKLGDLLEEAYAEDVKGRVVDAVSGVIGELRDEYGDMEELVGEAGVKELGLEDLEGLRRLDREW